MLWILCLFLLILFLFYKIVLFKLVIIIIEGLIWESSFLFIIYYSWFCQFFLLIISCDPNFPFSCNNDTISFSAIDPCNIIFWILKFRKWHLFWIWDIISDQSQLAELVWSPSINIHLTNGLFLDPLNFYFYSLMLKNWG